MTVVGGLACLAGLAWVVYLSWAEKRGGGSGESGQLRHGPFMWALAISFLALAVAPILSLRYGHDDEVLGAFLMAGLCGVVGVCCFAEAAFVRGWFDQDEIVLSTPWTGAKRESWKNLTSVEFSHQFKWYTLRFATGTTIRLSYYLYGHRMALNTAEQQKSR